MMEHIERIEVALCMGSACFARGNRQTADAISAFVKQYGLGNRVAIRGLLCEGDCRNGPHVRVNGRVCSLAPGEIPPELKKCAEGDGSA